MTPPPDPDPTMQTSASIVSPSRGRLHLERFRNLRGDACRAGIAEGRPVGVLARLGIGRPVREEQRHPRERRYAGRRVRGRQREVPQNLLARVLGRHAQEALLTEDVEQLLEPATNRLVRDLLDQLLDGLWKAHVGGRSREEAVRVVVALDARVDRVADRSKDSAPLVVHRSAERTTAAPPCAVPQASPRRFRPPPRAPRPSGSRRSHPGTR